MLGWYYNIYRDTIHGDKRKYIQNMKQFEQLVIEISKLKYYLNKTTYK